MSKEKKPWFPFYPRDFIIDTAAWAHEEIGVYIRLLMHEWTHGTIPENEDRVARILGMRASDAAFQEIWSIVGEKFSPGPDGGLINKRMEEERQKSITFQQQRKRAGLASAAARKAKAQRDSTPVEPKSAKKPPKKSEQKRSPEKKKTRSTRVESEKHIEPKDLSHPFGEIDEREFNEDINENSNEDATEDPMGDQPVHSSQYTGHNSQDTDNDAPRPSGTRGSRLTPPPPCPHQRIVDLYHECLPTLASVKVLNENRRRNLRDRWLTDRKYQTLKWWKGYFEYVSGRPFLLGKNDRNWRANFDFLIEESSFIRVIEGNYER